MLNTQNIMGYFTVVATLELQYDSFIIGNHHANLRKLNALIIVMDRCAI